MYLCRESSRYWDQIQQGSPAKVPQGGHWERLSRKSGLCQMMAEVYIGISYGRREGDEVLSYIIPFTSSSSCGKDLRTISISHLNPESQPASPGCVAYHIIGIQMIIEGEKIFQNHLCCALYLIPVFFCLVFSQGVFIRDSLCLI